MRVLGAVFLLVALASATKIRPFLTLSASSLPSQTGAHDPALMNPARLRAAYRIPENGGAGTIAIISAFHSQNALSDFNKFSTFYQLPLEASTHEEKNTNQVFQQILLNADGTEAVNPVPPSSEVIPLERFQWLRESAVDTQWAHAIAPKAKILLLEAPTNDAIALFNAANAALRYPNVKVVVMSWGAPELDFTAEELSAGESVFNKSGAVFLAASGDNLDISYPSTSPNVVAVGGTTLFLNSKRKVQESAFSLSTGGPSIKFDRPVYQNILRDIAGSRRVVPDVALVANPYTGVNSYMKLLERNGDDGWFGTGGTSLSVQIMGAMVNVAGAARGQFANSSMEELINIYRSMRLPVTAAKNRRRDITFGFAGQYIATEGWDPITGLGAPLGVGFDSPFIRTNTSKHFHRRRNDKLSLFPF